MDIRVYGDYREMSRGRRRSSPTSCVRSPTACWAWPQVQRRREYAELVRIYREGQVDFSQAHSFNLDDTSASLPMIRAAITYMWKNLFRHVNFDPKRVHIPSGVATTLQASACAMSG